MQSELTGVSREVVSVDAREHHLQQAMQDGFIPAAATPTDVWRLQTEWENLALSPQCDRRAFYAHKAICAWFKLDEMVGRVTRPVREPECYR